ncbi:Flavin reductase-like, FMN-binding [Rhodopseudomonas palustris HaA2]|uniref:Flavin reductase-like, FMN-binding n=1 Tax=Rhodopseudomonas palustris (strain HaA2) TaxID=316058 RepID=Q2J1E7_RHOP2|nr:flavin reductase family protein [Rhodopseudomonas palustris]ABD05713.1 Flavin reductase-like, FMN-binding [Rhodopseudomonas palustris HaA2]
MNIRPAALHRESAADSFKAAMRHLAGGVSIVTSGQDDERNGITATSVSSLSAEPPALIACINRSCALLPVIRERGTFGVNILAAGHRDLADRFAGRHGVRGAERYADGDWIELVTGAPLLSDALAAIDCTVDSIIDWNSHALVIGRVEAVQLGGASQALVYWRGGYHDIGGTE